ncbi:MAG: hypothetical protein NZ473_06605 [Candidatus Kapabacteria bacterium]|nr:hypothetical protein [Candidatus Kapabacteria bacterium]MCS7170588.1 hypothetical protein [Candidatus Kapabacteria bacterium]MDW7996619.1 hypothetical protein [Bacteroidota bacterium]MDW8224584.1 hypothetical protein [Bacteroidota bacterium]
MAESIVEVFVCRGFSGQIFRLQLPAEASVEQLLERLRQEFGMWAEPEALGLYNLTQDFEYLRTDTLAQRGTQPSDLLLVAEGGTCLKR